MHSNAARYEILGLVACIHPPMLRLRSPARASLSASASRFKFSLAAVDPFGSKDQQADDKNVMLTVKYLSIFMVLATTKMGAVYSSGHARSALVEAIAEGCRDVALVTGPAKGSAVRVVLAVTSKTGRRRRDFIFGLRRVTGFALGLAMSTGQRIFGVLVVIETPERPAVRVVAMLTCRPKLALMLSILVALGTEFWRIAEGLRAMTGFAWHRRVQANQWKSCEVVIERDFLPPTDFVVTGFAVRAELTLMGVVGLVAGDAGCGDLIAIEVALVTGIAFDFFVCAPQRKFC